MKCLLKHDKQESGINCLVLNDISLISAAAVMNYCYSSPLW